jgi:hypothetical protein
MMKMVHGILYELVRWNKMNKYILLTCILILSGCTYAEQVNETHIPQSIGDYETSREDNLNER